MIETAAIQDLVSRWWFNYDEGNFKVLAELLTEDVHFSCRTDSGATDYEEFVRADYRGRDAVMAWQTDHREHSPYPLRHHAANIHVVAERGDEIDLESYLFVTQIIDRKPSALSSGLVHFTLIRTADGYRIRYKEVVLDSIESAPFDTVEFVTDRQQTW